MPTDLWQDVRFATRLLIKDRWFTLAATTALALGIGANAAVFTFVNAVLVRGLPFHETDRIVTVWTEDDRDRRMNTSKLDYEDWRSQARSFSELAATLGSSMNVSDEGRPVYPLPNGPGVRKGVNRCTWSASVFLASF
jgi:putative ABC transport system permease protein